MIKTLIILLGPTAIGKTKLAIDLAGEFETEIISSDSRQFYKEMYIGTARPGKNERKGIIHHLVGHLSVADYYNVSMFEQAVLELLDGIFAGSDYAIMTGGSGMYIDVVSQGIDAFPDVDNKLRQQLIIDYETYGLQYIQDKLLELDAEYYKDVDRANPKRILRAIEICLTTGRKYSELRLNKSVPRNFRIIKIGLNIDRKVLFERINCRVDEMIQAGLVDEARSLIKYRNLNALNTVGYKEIFEYFDGNVTLDKAIENIKTNTRRYAKRQLTWFKRDKEIQWFEPDSFDKIVSCIRRKLDS